MTIRARLALAFRVLRGLAGVMPASATVCQNCERLAREVEYWRAREERTADALHAMRGVTAPVAQAPAKAPVNPLMSVFTAMNMTEVPEPSSQPGREAMTSAHAAN